MEAALSQIDVVTRHLSDNSDRLTTTMEKVMVCLFSPSPTFTEVSGAGIMMQTPMLQQKKVKVVVESSG